MRYHTDHNTRSTSFSLIRVFRQNVPFYSRPSFSHCAGTYFILLCILCADRVFSILRISILFNCFRTLGHKHERCTSLIAALFPSAKPVA